MLKVSQYKNKILLGDTCDILQSIPDEVVDLGITSPPYNKQEKNRGWLVKNVLYSEYQDKLPECEYQKNQVAILNDIYRITKAGGSFFYNHKIRWEEGEMFHPMDWLRKTNWTVKQEIIWDRVIAGNIRGWRFWQVEERIYWLYKPVDNNKKGRELASKDAKMTSIWRSVPESNNPHPAPFPLWLPTRIILSLLDEKAGGLVIDPYMGSGTTAVAAKLLGFDYLGIEIGKIYLDMAKDRLKNAQCEIDKIEKEKRLHQVTETFKERKANNKNVGKYQTRRADKQLDIAFR